MTPPAPPAPAASSPILGDSPRCGGGGGAYGGDGYDPVGPRPGGDMATTRPRLFLWEPRGSGEGAGGYGPLPRRREVTFRDGEAEEDGGGGGGGGGRPSMAPPVGASANSPATVAAVPAAAVALAGHREREAAAAAAAGVGSVATGRVGGGSGNMVLRPDFIQLSYAMKKGPTRGGAAGASGAQWGQVRNSAVCVPGWMGFFLGRDLCRSSPEGFAKRGAWCGKCGTWWGAKRKRAEPLETTNH